MWLVLGLLHNSLSFSISISISISLSLSLSASRTRARSLHLSLSRSLSDRLALEHGLDMLELVVTDVAKHVIQISNLRSARARRAPGLVRILQRQRPITFQPYKDSVE